MKKSPSNHRTRGTVIALLLALALPACSDGIDQEQEYQQQMIADLLRLGAAQEARFTQVGSYTADLSQLTLTRTDGVLLSVQYVTNTGWGAEANAGGSRYHCALYEGATETSFLSRWAGILEGEPKCKPIPSPAK